MNKVFLIGNLTRDPELTETASGVPVCHFAIAVNRNYAGQDGERQTDFFNCTAWRAMAETIAYHLMSGNVTVVSVPRKINRSLTSTYFCTRHHQGAHNVVYQF